MRTLSFSCFSACLLALVSARAVQQQLQQQLRSACSFETDDYSLSWEFDELSSDVVFKLSATSDHPSFWSGVYFGDDTNATDVIGVFVRSGQIGLVDGHVNEESDIESDKTTNVQSLAFDLQGRTLSAEFARPLTSADKTDVDLANCVTFYFPTTAPAIDIGGPIEIPKSMEKRRVCDLAVSCSSGHAAVVKRAEETTCKYENGNQKKSVSWRRVGSDVVFSVSQPVKKGKFWTAIGVGESMQDMNLVVAFADNGKIEKTGGYKTAGYGIPEVDAQLTTSHQLETQSNDDSKVTFDVRVPESFVTSRMTDGCVTLQVAILGGGYTKKGGEFNIQKHKETPVAVSLCNLDQCAMENSSASAAATTTNTNEVKEIVAKKSSASEADEADHELLSAGNPKREESTSEIEGSGQSVGLFETASRELQQTGSGEEPAGSNSTNIDVASTVVPSNGDPTASLTAFLLSSILPMISGKGHEHSATTAAGNLPEPIIGSNGHGEFFTENTTIVLTSGVAISKERLNDLNNSLTVPVDEENSQNPEASLLAPSPSPVTVREVPTITDAPNLLATSLSNMSINNQGLSSPAANGPQTASGATEVPQSGSPAPEQPQSGNQSSEGSQSASLAPEQPQPGNQPSEGLQSSSPASEVIPSKDLVPQSTQFGIPNAESVQSGSPAPQNSQLGNLDNSSVPISEPGNEIGNHISTVLPSFMENQNVTSTTIPLDIVTKIEKAHGSSGAIEVTTTSHAPLSIFEMGQPAKAVSVGPESTSIQSILDLNGSLLAQTVLPTNSTVEHPKGEEEGSGENQITEVNRNQINAVVTNAPENKNEVEVTTTTPAVLIDGSISLATTASPQQTCPQEDLKVCQTYFDDYLIKVADWAQRHKYTARSQQWKACKLLAEVKNVATLCCNRFQKECAGVTPPPE